MTRVNTEGQWVEFSEATGTTLTSGNTYTLQVLNTCYMAIGNNDEVCINWSLPFTYKASDDDLLVMTPEGSSCVISVIAEET